MAGKHRLARRTARTEPPRRLYTTEVVEALTGVAHQVTGGLGGGRFAAVCGRQVVGASLTVKGHADLNGGGHET